MEGEEEMVSRVVEEGAGERREELRKMDTRMKKKK